MTANNWLLILILIVKNASLPCLIHIISWTIGDIYRYAVSFEVLALKESSVAEITFKVIQSDQQWWMLINHI